MKKFNPNEPFPEETVVKMFGSFESPEPLIRQIDDETATALANIRKKIEHVYFYQTDEVDDGVPFMIVGNGEEDPISHSESKVLMEFVQSTMDEFGADCSDEDLYTLPWVASFNCYFNDKLFNPTTH